MIKACVLRTGGDFTVEHVQWLARQVPGLICLSDVDVPGVECRPLQSDWPGWWAKMEMFGTTLEGDVLMLDLDTVVLDMPERPARTTVLRDFTQPDIMGSGLMYVTEEDRARVWSAWSEDPAGHMARCQRWPKLGDQGFLQHHIGDAAKWSDDIRSYKVHCAHGVPWGTKVVCFHGQPRPWDVRDAWVPQFKAPRVRSDFRELILAHRGARVIVMGGAPSLAADMFTIGSEAGDVVISTNGHGAGLGEWRIDYMLAMDETHSRERCPMGAFLRSKSGAPIISPHGYADIRLGMWPQNPRFVLSGMVATWAGWAMGARVVILAGCDAYGGEAGYVEEARKMARDVHGPVRVASGPLTKVWPAYNPEEKFMDNPHSSIDALKGIDGRIKIRARKPCTVGLVDLKGGDEMVVMRHEVSRLLKHRMVEEMSYAPADVGDSDAQPARRGRKKAE